MQEIILLELIIVPLGIIVLLLLEYTDFFDNF